MRAFEEILADAIMAISLNDVVHAIALSEELRASDAPASAALEHRLRGFCAHSAGRYEESLALYARALELCEQLDDRSVVAALNNNIGNTYHSTGNYSEALSYFHRALAEYEALNDLSSVADVMGNIGNILADSLSHEKALDFYGRALAIHEQRGNRIGVATVTGNIGNVHISSGAFQDSIQYLERALHLHHEDGDVASAARVTANLAGALLYAGRPEEAREQLRAFSLLDVQDPSTWVVAQFIHATLLEQDGDLDEAWNVCLRILACAEEHNLRVTRMDANLSLRDLAQQRGDFEGYVRHNSAYIQLNNEVAGGDTALMVSIHEQQSKINALDRDFQRQSAVLHSTLPKHVAERVARGEVVNDAFEDAAVLFLDVVGFTTLSSTLSASEVVQVLQPIFTAFDAICATYNVIKIKTIGDAYMAVAFPDEEHTQYERLAHCALNMLTVDAPNVSFRIGLHCGPIVAGVLGTERLQYDVWGDTVNVASRMESAGEAGRVHLSEAFAMNLKSNQESRIKNPIPESHEVSHASVAHGVARSSLVTTSRGSIDIKGKGPMQTYWLERA